MAQLGFSLTSPVRIWASRRLEELNLVQMAGGLHQPQICHKQMLMFQLGIVGFFSVRGILRSFQGLS